MMRAARFVAQLGFRPAPEVVAAMKGMAERISIISAERIRDELSKLLLTDRPRPGIDLLVSTELAAKVTKGCGPIRRFVAMSAMPATSWLGCTS